MIKKFYVIQKFQKISEILDLELLKSKQKTGTLHIITKSLSSGGFNILKFFKDFNKFEQFLKNFQFKLKTFSEEEFSKN